MADNGGRIVFYWIGTLAILGWVAYGLACLLSARSWVPGWTSKGWSP